MSVAATDRVEVLDRHHWIDPVFLVVAAIESHQHARVSRDLEPVVRVAGGPLGAKQQFEIAVGDLEIAFVDVNVIDAGEIVLPREARNCCVKWLSSLCRRCRYCR